jgi:mono/diheme cytochrome c family protein
MSKTPLRIFGLVAVIVAVVAFTAFVSRGSDDAATVPVQSADRDAQKMFATNCGTCHTLAAGETDGVVGPNLDEILPLSPIAATGSAEEVQKSNLTNWSSVYGRVLNAVTCGLNGRMPRGILQGADAQEVAGFVAAYAGQLGPDQGPLVPASERKLTPPPSCGGEGGTGETSGPSGSGSGGSSSGSSQGSGTEG